MTNPTYSSPKPTPKEANRRIRELAAKGEWPPAGHPWRELALLPHPQVVQFFQQAEWLALVKGLAQLRADAIRVAVNTAKPQPLRDEACGMLKAVETILGLPSELDALYKIIKEAENTDA